MAKVKGVVRKRLLSGMCAGCGCDRIFEPGGRPCGCGSYYLIEESVKEYKVPK